MANLKEKRAAALKAAKDIIAVCKAEGRDLTDQERTSVEKHASDIKAWDEDIRRIEDQPSLLKGIADLAHNDGDETGGRFLALGSKSFTSAVASGMVGGAKALTPSGQTTVSIPLVNSAPVSLGRPLNTLLEILPVVERAPHYSVLRQVTRTNNAAPVAPGALKPTSLLGLTKEDNRLRVVASLSEPIDKYVLQDNSNLQIWIATELAGGVRDALEAQVLNGNGTGENFRGLTATSGVQIVTAASADRLVSLRQAVTAVETSGYIPSVFVVNPADWQGIETKRNTSGGFDLGGPVDAATRKAWGVPVAVSGQVPAGTAWLLSEGAVVLGVDRANGLVTEWGNPGDTFSRNQIVARTEGRFSLDVIAPMGVAKVTLDPA